MPVLDHTHGVNQARCDHPDCQAAVYRYQKRWRYERAQGLLRTVSVDRVRLHIATLQGAGWSVRAIAEAAHVSPTTVSRVGRRTQEHVSRKAAAAIMSLDPSAQPRRSASRGFVPRVGTTRRIQALLRMGWSHEAMGEHLGEPMQYTVNKLHQRGQWVTRDVHERVATMYRDLATKAGPSTRTAMRAEARGYPGPLDWQDIDHDAEPETPWVLKRDGSPDSGVWVHPDEAPYAADDAPRIHDVRLADDEADDIDHAVVQRFIDGGEKVRRFTHAESAEIVRRLRARGVNGAGFKGERYDAS